MSRKTEFHKYILQETSVQSIYCAGQGEEERILRSAIILAAQKTHAPALTALFPLIKIKESFMDEVLQIIYSKKNCLELLKCIPDNSILLMANHLRDFCSKQDDAVAAQLVRIFEFQSNQLLYHIPSFAKLDCEKTVEQSLLKKDKKFPENLLMYSWDMSSQKTIDIIIKHIKNLDDFFYRHQDAIRRHHNYIKSNDFISTLENEISSRQNLLLKKSLVIPKTPVPVKRKI